MCNSAICHKTYKVYDSSGDMLEYAIEGHHETCLLVLNMLILDSKFFMIEMTDIDDDNKRIVGTIKSNTFAVLSNVFPNRLLKKYFPKIGKARPKLIRQNAMWFRDFDDGDIPAEFL